MINAAPRPILVSMLIGTLLMYVTTLIWDNRTTSHRNRTLLEQSQALQKTLETIQTQYRTLLNNTEKNESDKASLRDTIEKLKKQNESLTFQIQKIESQIGSVKEEKSYLEEMLINKTKQIEILKEGNTGTGEIIGYNESGEIRSQISEKDDELKKLNEQNRILQEKLDRMFKTTNEKMGEINIAKMALSETVSTAQRRIEDEWNTVNLGSVTTSAMPARQNDVEEAPRGPKSEGHVLAINNEHGFVVIDMGKIDNLTEDARLEVKKDGVPIATLSVLEIRDVMAACNIQEVQDGKRIEINDPVSVLR